MQARSRMRRPAFEAKGRASATMARMASSLKASSTASNGTPSYVTRPITGEGDTPTRNSQAQ